METTQRRTELPYSPGLDGIRAFAVLAVIAYHNPFTWLPGGYYGVDAFFVLSGYLITSLLLAEWRGAGTVRLGAFWARRARRLLPAVLVLVLVIGVVAAVWPASFDATNLLSQSLATVGYSANWYYTTTHVTYFTASAAPSPLLHTWSLAIEEQFYLVWPLVVLTVLGGWRRHGRRRAGPDAAGGTGVDDGNRGSAADSASDAWQRRRLRVLLYISVFGAAGSAILMAAVSSDANGINRAYYGTDTRAQGLLVGAALATAFTLLGRGRARSGQVGWAAIGFVGAAAVGVMWARVPEASWLAFHGGFLLVSMACAAVVASVVKAPTGAVPRLLATWPLRSLGRISYGVYLWYWPVLLVVSQQRTGLGLWPLFAWRVTITVALAAISYFVVEQPIRRGALPWRRALVAAPLAAGLVFGVAALGTSVASAALVRPGSALASDTVSTRGGDAAGLVVSGGQEVKVLLVGDSMAGTLGVGLAAEAPRYGLQFMNDGTPQCSLSMDQEFQVLWYRLAPAPPCKPGDPDALFQRWRQIVDAYNPDVVVYLGRGEQFDQEVGGRWGHLGQRWFDEWVASRFRQAVGVLGSSGAAVVLMLPPASDSGESTHSVAVEDQPERVTIDSSIIGDIAAQAEAAADPTAGGGLADRPRSTPQLSAASLNRTGPSSVTTFNLAALVSPGNRFASSIGGTLMRCSDGVHFTTAAGQVVATKLFPVLMALGRLHHNAHPGGRWPGSPPPADPSWTSELNC
ncbi:MAG: acyltransferase family protein [Acidimicrobiales bacterium]|jgi:peptidoglycan/LPS O-acetylase OafA/YrhL